MLQIEGRALRKSCEKETKGPSGWGFTVKGREMWNEARELITDWRCRPCRPVKYVNIISQRSGIRFAFYDDLTEYLLA